MSTNTRAAVLFAALAVGALGALVNEVLVVVEGPLDVNVKEAYFFERPNVATYRYNNGTAGDEQVLVLRGEVLNATARNVTLTVDGSLLGSFVASPDGTLPGTGGAYSIWWLFIPNPVLMKWGATEYNVVDPTGFLGVPGKNYTASVTGRSVYWPTEKFQAALLGAQAALDLVLLDDAGRVVAEARLDLTCGVIMEGRGDASGLGASLKLVETTFPMSRNRLVLLALGAALSIAFVLLALATSERKFGLSHEQRSEVVTLLSLGCAAILLEEVDIWFYVPFGEDGMQGLHLAFLACMAVACWRFGYGYKWLIPAATEVAFVFTITTFVGEPFVPVLTANLGSTLSWVAMVWASGYERHADEALPPVKRALSTLV